MLIGIAVWRCPDDRIGDVLMAQDNMADALKAFEDQFAIAERLARIDPGNAGWQRDLSVCHEKVGDVQMAQGNLPEALKSYRAGLRDQRAAGAQRSR